MACGEGAARHKAVLGSGAIRLYDSRELADHWFNIPVVICPPRRRGYLNRDAPERKSHATGDSGEPLIIRCNPE